MLRDVCDKWNVVNIAKELSFLFTSKDQEYWHLLLSPVRWIGDDPRCRPSGSGGECGVIGRCSQSPWLAMKE